MLTSTCQEKQWGHQWRLFFWCRIYQPKCWKRVTVRKSCQLPMIPLMKLWLPRHRRLHSLSWGEQRGLHKSWWCRKWHHCTKNLPQPLTKPRITIEKNESWTNNHVTLTPPSGGVKWSWDFLTGKSADSGSPDIAGDWLWLLEVMISFFWDDVLKEDAMESLCFKSSWIDIVCLCPRRDSEIKWTLIFVCAQKTVIESLLPKPRSLCMISNDVVRELDFTPYVLAARETLQIISYFKHTSFVLLTAQLLRSQLSSQRVFLILMSYLFGAFWKYSVTLQNSNLLNSIVCLLTDIFANFT